MTNKDEILKKMVEAIADTPIEDLNAGSIFNTMFTSANYTVKWDMAKPTFSIEIPSPGLDHPTSKAITNIYNAFASFGIEAGRILITHQIGQPGTTPSHVHHYD
jgi:hypothetical protein